MTPLKDDGMAKPVMPQSRSGPDAEASGPTDAAGVDPSSTHNSQHQPFGAELEPVLLSACHQRLSAVNWFRTDWQRGGALTGYATYIDDSGQPQPVVVKLPVPPGERQWLERLQAADNVVPKLYAHGETLGGYDLAWVVMERMAHGPLGSAWGGKEFDLLVQTAGRFYAAAQAYPVTTTPPKRDWDRIFHHAREQVHRHNLAQEQRWSKALKKAHRKLKKWLAVWDHRPVDQWCHGDLHLGNAMTRLPPPQGPAVLIDFAVVHPGHWVEDAVYFEHLYWSRPDRLGGRKFCKAIAHERKQHGVKVDPDWSRLASVMRALFAMSTPVMLEQVGDPRHVHAALEVLEREVE